MQPSISVLLYDPVYTQETFGTLTPDINERTKVFTELWDQWSSNEILLQTKTPAVVRAQLKQMGLVEHYEFQIRGRRARFSTPDAQALAILTGVQDV